MSTATKNRVQWVRADNKRVSRKGALGGWDQLRARLVGDELGRPMVYCFGTCAASIRTIPALQHDPDNPEDLDTDGEDHAADEWRYACMSRPWVPKAQAEAAPPSHEIQAFVGPSQDGKQIIAKTNLTVRQIFDRHFRRKAKQRKYG
jgi:hypothetical protein